MTTLRFEKQSRKQAIVWRRRRSWAPGETDTVDRDAKTIMLDGLSMAEVKVPRDSAEKHAFQAEVNRMMKLVITSFYKNKEVFLRELIFNASDALDKIRFLMLTDKSILYATEELIIKIRVDKENKVLRFYSAFLVADKVVVTGAGRCQGAYQEVLSVHQL